ncbi:MAG: MFS transporter [Coriobacteriia bacterium]
MTPATKGTVVVFAGFVITLSLGSLWIWVSIAAELLRPLSAGGVHGWTVRQVSIPFALAGASFVLAMFIGGRLQDRLGPRWPSTAGGVLIGMGMILASMSPVQIEPSSIAPFMLLGLGFMVGGGAGFAFASVVPPTVKWSLQRYRGLMVGVLVAGFGLGPAWTAQAVRLFVQERGVSSVLLLQGIVLLAFIVLFSQLLTDPLRGYVPPGSYETPDGPSDALLPWAGLSPSKTFAAPAYRALAVGSGLMAAASSFFMARLLLESAVHPMSGAGVAIGISLVGSAGALIAGTVHDRMAEFGLTAVFSLIAAALAAAAILTWTGHFVAAVLLTAACSLGAVVVTWVSTMECFGTRNAGANYGLVFAGGSLGFLLGALVAVSLAGGASFSSATLDEALFAAILLALVLGTAVVLTTRVRPMAASGTAAGSRSDRRTEA